MASDERQAAPRVRLIAIVDDDDAVRDALENFVRSLGYGPAVFASAEQFLLASNIQGICCLITDLHMVGMSGTTLMQRVHEQRRDLPVIIITAFPDSRLLNEPSAARAAAVFSKPFVAEDLARRLHEICGGP
jgi:FixJ family two-component response regulator